MKAYDLVELAARNLREAVLRNSLTTLGIGVGVASLVAMLSLGIGLQKLVNRQLGRSGLFDSIFVTSRQGAGRRIAQAPVITGAPKSLDDAARKGFAAMPEVLEVYPIISATGEFRTEARPEDAHFTVVGALPPSARAGEAFDELQGSYFSGEDQPEVLILSDFARELLGLPAEPRLNEQSLKPEQAAQLLGKQLTFRYAEREASDSTAAPTPAPSVGPGQKGGAQPADETLGASSAFSVVRREQKVKIVGILNSEPYRGLRSGSTSVFLPLAFAEGLNIMQPGDLRNIMRPGQGKNYSALLVRVAKSKDVQAVEEKIRQQGFSSFSLLDASRNVTIFFTILDMFLGVFGSLALAVASLGIINTLVMAILERRREIGIMKALGASDGDVKRIFFFEAGTMGILGGALGIAIGWGIGRVINFGTNIYLRRLDIKPENFWYVPLWLVLAAMGFAVVVSLGAGLYPASRAAKLDPVKALRHD
ncbi:MAG TPA: ABC transporter permease [Candidatus Saccharimonadales bacterium]|jgi:putative ABC transport system permease protein|nr:ABC transporter permease [Candidatus Saccharimonadales bacterium]